MRRLAWATIGILVCQGVAQAQPQLDLETLRKVPPSAAIVLDPVANWYSVHWPDSPHARIVGIDQSAGHPTMRVAEPGKRHPWGRRLAIPFDPQRYPITVMTYRATGILATEERLLWLDDTSGAARGRVQPFLNEDVVADGEIHEISGDLRELSPKAEIIIVRIYPHCHGPEPAVFELLGLRFESDHDVPPHEQREEPEFSVCVTDEKGAPILGALLTVDAERLNWSRSATTDAAGKASVRAMNNPFNRHVLRVTAKGMIPRDIDSRSAALGKLPTTVQMVRAASYGGVVLDEDGKPIRHASVVVQTHWAGGNKTATILSDGEGRWRAPLMPADPRQVSVTLRHQDYVSEPARVPPTHDLRAGKADLVMRRGLLLSGIVIGPDGTCVSEAQVRQGRDRWQTNHPQAQTDGEGRFEFPQSMPGNAVLTVQAAGFAPTLVKLDVKEDMEEPIIELTPPNTIWGRVVDGEDAPIAGVRVAVSGWRGLTTITWNMTTKEDGRFEWPDAPSDEVQFQFTKSGQRSLHGQPLIASDKEHVVVMSAPLQVEGTVRDAATGKPVASYTLVPGFAWWQDGRATRNPPQWQRTQAVSFPGGYYSYRFPDWRIGGNGIRMAYVLRVEAKGYAPLVSREFGPGEGKNQLDFALKKGTDIGGRILLPDGKPARGTDVFLVTAGSSFRVRNGRAPRHTNAARQETDANGRYSFAMETAAWRLVAVHDAGYAESDSASYDKSPDLVLQPWARVEGAFRLGTGPARNRKLQIWPVRTGGKDAPRIHHEQQTRTDEQGRFGFPRVPPGSGVVGVQTTTGPHSWTITRGEDCEFAPGRVIRLTLGGEGRPVTGRLALPPKATVKAAWSLTQTRLIAQAVAPAHQPDQVKALVERPKHSAIAQSQAQPKQYEVSMEADGAFRAEDVPAGRYTLSFVVRRAAGKPLRPQHTVAGSLMHEFTVPEMAGGRNDRPLALGTLTVPLREQPARAEK